MNYTYVEVRLSMGAYFDIMDKDGEPIASAFSEESAALIVSALNGTEQNVNHITVSIK